MIQLIETEGIKLLTFHFCLFYGLFQIVIHTLIKAIATHETHFSIKPVF